MGALAIALLVFSLAKLTDANEFLAAFGAGVTVTAVAPQMAASFHAAGSVIAETLKLAAVLAFGALLSSQFVNGVTVTEWVFALTALLLARPVALAPSLLMTGLSWREHLAVAWFGPKGFASIFFGVLILASGVPDAERLFRLVALVVAASIVAHSSTDVLVVRWLTQAPPSRSSPEHPAQSAH
jgi:NhaP-type Na+/H+ and K+/H+ antiporter